VTSAKRDIRYVFLIAITGILLFSMMDAVMKAQALALGTFNAMFWRMAMGALFVSVLYLPTRPRLASGKVLKIHFIRAGLTAVMAYLFFFGLTRVPLAQAIGLSFVAPIVTLFLAVPMLGEQIGANAKLAAVLGFGGVMTVVGGEVLGDHRDGDLLGMLSILLSALLYGVNLILQRMQALIAKPLEIAFYQNLIVFFILLMAAPFFLVVPTEFAHWGGSALAAAFAVASLMLMSHAYSQAEAQRLVAVEYTAFIWAAILGWWFFAEPVTARTLLGTGLIVLGCLISARGQ
jgi:S-adenosylmethionine uptake transporter